MAQAVVVISKNANVATGQPGIDDAGTVTDIVAERVGCDPTDVILTSTGVIGRRYPIDRVTAGLVSIPQPLPGTDADGPARAMMTTDTVPKLATASIPSTSGEARIIGMAKGVGMIEPDMATHISMLFTDAAINSADLDAIFRRVVDRTFNCVSIDTDTSTSDSSIVMASGAAGAVDLAAFETALFDVAVDLTKQIARDGEGANSLIEVVVDGAVDTAQAKRVAKAVVNSPLVKTAVHGGDPNWGRVAMAIGKCSEQPEDRRINQDAVVIRFGSDEVYPRQLDDAALAELSSYMSGDHVVIHGKCSEQPEDLHIDQDAVLIRFGSDEVYPRQLDDAALAELSSYMSGDHVVIHVSLGIGAGSATVWGCDLSDTYVRFNADYTT